MDNATIMEKVKKGKTLTEKQARILGWVLVKGAYQGTSSDVAGRWYLYGPEEALMEMEGPGHENKKEALLKLAKILRGEI